MTRRRRHQAAALLAAVAVALLSGTAAPAWPAVALALSLTVAGPHRRSVLRAGLRCLPVALLAAAGWLLVPGTRPGDPAVAGRLILRVLAMTLVTVTAALRVDWWLIVRGHPGATTLLVVVTREIAVLQRLLRDLGDALACRSPGRPDLRTAVRYGGGVGAQLLQRAMARGELTRQGLVARGVLDAED